MIGAEQSSTDLTNEHSGRFIGESVDGPVAVGGKWKVEVGTFTINGQFGADAVPAPWCTESRSSQATGALNGMHAELAWQGMPARLFPGPGWSASRISGIARTIARTAGS